MAIWQYVLDNDIMKISRQSLISTYAETHYVDDEIVFILRDRNYGSAFDVGYWFRASYNTNVDGTISSATRPYIYWASNPFSNPYSPGSAGDLIYNCPFNYEIEIIEQTATISVNRTKVTFRHGFYMHAQTVPTEDYPGSVVFDFPYILDTVVRGFPSFLILSKM